MVGIVILTEARLLALAIEAVVHVDAIVVVAVINSPTLRLYAACGAVAVVERCTMNNLFSAVVFVILSRKFIFWNVSVCVLFGVIESMRRVYDYENWEFLFG